MEQRFPPGGPRQPVYDFLLRNGFVMSRDNDKRWLRADGVTLHVYGSGSKALVRDKDKNLIADDAIDVAVDKIKLN